jgi:hypothetical protein
VRSRCLNEFFLLARMQSGTAFLILPLLAEKQKSTLATLFFDLRSNSTNSYFHFLKAKDKKPI